MKKGLLLPYIALVSICLIWGTTYLALRIAVTHFPPFLFVVIRQIIAGLILGGGVMLVRKTSLPSWREIRRQAIAGFFMISLGNGLVAWAEVEIPSGIAAIICSLMPVMVILINLTINKDEKPTVPILLGVAMGLAGIVMIFGENISEFANPTYLLSIIMVFVGVISWAGGSIWLKKDKTTSDPFLNAGIQMFFGGVWLIPFSLFFDDLETVRWTPEAAYALVYLIILGSVVAYACYTFVLRKLPMTIVSLYAYVNPLVAVFLGWLILDEQLNLNTVIAFALTVAGIYVVNRGYQLRDAWRAQLSDR
ncbi:DMT family transporter [Pseudochryseolinea flava]|uniref:EamA family transporter n=1 Tax=Pseudochryseolinea flava TaxID=2059302 RepID=A0A364Y0J6_9BACT|nr:EamA family transporter [Pseudochryseolinea flava]RAV99432.1 EamA family transporter [Pseudochryseolinea flava]